MNEFGVITKETYELLEQDPNRSDVSDHDKFVYEIWKVREHRMEEVGKAAAEVFSKALGL